MKARVAVLLMAALVLAGAAPQTTSPPPAADSVELRHELVVRLNHDREVAGVPLVAPLAALDQVAQRRAAEIEARCALPDENEAMSLFGKVQSWLARAGYSAHGWTESVTTAPRGDLESALTAWKQDPNYPQALDPDYQHVGIGVARLNGEPLYVFLLAWPRSEYFARETRGLADLQAAREAVLARVNAARREAGVPPVELEPRLTAAAQAHADDMLARSYYAHRSLDGTVPYDRVRARGYVPDLVAENIAAGHFNVETVMEAWLHSVDHRRNLLDRRLTQLGVGIAVGTFEHRYKVMWVQDFARPQGGSPGT
jgi:uncharacterized protein YkwD